MQIGVSTACLYPAETEKALSQLLDMGFREFEIFLNTFTETQKEFLLPLRAQLEKAGATVFSIHPFTSAFENMLFFSEYPRRTKDGIQFYHCFFEAANLMGAKILVLHGQRNYQNSKITEGEYLENYHRLFQEGKRFGITVAQENVVHFRSEKVEFIRRMRESLQKECAFVLDIKQAVRAGESPLEMCEAMGDRLLHVHFNDHREGADCLLPGQGNFDFSKLFQLLRNNGYQGQGVVEVYRDNYSKLEELWQSREYLLTQCNGIL